MAPPLLRVTAVMRGYTIPWVASFALAAAVANGAASDLQTARKDAAAARGRVNDIRAQQMALRSELNQVAAQIEALKARKKGALLKGGELDASLRRSQELSDQLTDAARELARAEGDLQSGNLALIDALSGELESLRARWDARRERTARADLLARMRALRAERAQVYAMLPAGSTPAVDVRGSDDPEDLLEQADALRDSEDKIRQQIKAVEGRIAEVRRERDLERRMSDFLGEEALFEEQDRRLRRSTSSGALESSGGTAASAPVPPATQSDGTATAGSTGTFTAPSDTTKISTPPPATAPAQTAPSEFSTQRSDGRTMLGTGVLIEEGGARELPSLEARLKQLRSLAKQIDERADAIEARARGAR